MTKQTLKNWHPAKIKDFGRVITGKTPPTKNKEYYGNKYPFITPTDISDQSIYVEPERYLSEEGADKVASSRLPKEAVCYTCIASVGKITITKETSFSNQQINSVITNPDVADYRYVFYLLKNITPDIKRMTGGAASPIINKTAFGDININIPDLPTQKQIASILSAYDDLIENNNRRIRILEQTAQTVYTEWFVDFRFPGHEKVKMVDSGTDFGKIPEGWKIKKLGEKIKLQRGRNITKNTIQPGDIPVVAGGISPAYFHNVANVEGPAITISASGANSGYINLYQENIWASDCSYVSKKTTPLIYFYYLTLKMRQSEVTSLQRGSAQPHVYPKDLHELIVVDPPQELVAIFENYAENLFSLIGNLRSQIKNLQQARDLLLPKLVTGEIQV